MTIFVASAHRCNSAAAGSGLASTAYAAATEVTARRLREFALCTYGYLRVCMGEFGNGEVLGGGGITS